MSAIFKELPKGAQAEIHTRTVDSVSVRFQNNEFAGTSKSRNTSSTLRLIQSGKMSVAGSSKPRSEKEMLKNALELVKYGNDVAYEFPGQSPISEMEIACDKVSQVDLKTMVEISEDLLLAMRECDAAIRASASVGWREMAVTLANSNGFDGSYRKTVWSASVGGRLIQGDDFLGFGESRSSWSTDIDYEGLKKEAAQRFEWARHVTDFVPGTYPVIFAPGEVGNLMRPFLSSLNGKAFVQGISPLKERLGQQLLDPRVTLVDDGTLPRETPSVPFDREGIPTRRNVLIENGVARDLLLDLETAKALGRESTGNGSGGGPSPHCTILVPGDKTLDELLKGIDRGLIIFGTMGAWTGNPYSGNVSGTVSLGLKVENGKIAGRVKNCMFSVNSFTHFKDHLIGFSKETKPSGGSNYPYVALDEVVITTK